MSRTVRRTRKGRWTTKGKQNAHIAAINRKYPYPTTYRERTSFSGLFWYDYRQAIKQVDYLHWQSTPSWWNHERHTVPRRQKERALLNKIRSGYLDADDVVFPNGSKPHIYFW